MFHTFQNYTLTYADTDICSLSPHLAPLHIHYEALDYQSFVNLFPSSRLGIEDANSVLRTLSEANLMHHQFTGLFETKPSSTASANPSILLDSSTSLLKNVFLQMISCLTNPFLSGFFSIFLFLASSGLLFSPFGLFVFYCLLSVAPFTADFALLLTINSFFFCGRFLKLLCLSTHHFQKFGVEITCV